MERDIMDATLYKTDIISVAITLFACRVAQTSCFLKYVFEQDHNILQTKPSRALFNHRPPLRSVEKRGVKDKTGDIKR